MKYLAILLFCFLFFEKIAAQTPCDDKADNWILSKGSSVVQFVYTDSINADSATLANKILIQLKSISGVKNIQILSGSIVFEMEGREIDYKSQGYKWGTVPLAILLHPLSYKGSIDVKNGKYRVTISNLTSKIPGMYDTKTIFDWNKDVFNGEGCIMSFRKDKILESLNIISKDIHSTYLLKTIVQKSDW